MKTSNRVGIRTCSDYSPFGVELDGRTVSVGYRYGFNGKENICDISGDGNVYDLGARVFNSRLGKLISPDPMETNYPWQGSYSYFKNSPVSVIDFNGEGDYYGKNGKHLGSDGIKDNLAYTATGVKKQEIMEEGKGTGKYKTIYENAVKLSVSNSLLNQYANTVAQESSGNKLESYALASAINNLSKVNYKGNIFNTISAKNQIFGFSDGGNSIEYKNNSEFSMEAVLNALSGGYDYSNGAIRWDGFDFAARGLKHPKALNQGIHISAEHLYAFKASWSDKLIKAYSAGKYTSFSPTLKINKGETFLMKQAEFTNKGMVLYSSSAVHGRTIFWSANKNYFIKGSDKTKIDVNKNFKGTF